MLSTNLKGRLTEEVLWGNHFCGFMFQNQIILLCLKILVTHPGTGPDSGHTRKVLATGKAVNARQIKGRDSAPKELPASSSPPWRRALVATGTLWEGLNKQAQHPTPTQWFIALAWCQFPGQNSSMPFGL